MCAAVIGRQLRQQAVSGRSSGPLLPAQIPFGKNRPRAPSHALIPPRPHSPVPPGAGGHLVGSNYPAFLDHNQVEPTVITFPIQAPSDRLNVTSKLTTGGAINAVVAQREQRALANQLRKLDMQRTSPKLRCTWHCFCVALRALSGGLVLLIVGTIMSVFGFVMENEQKQKAKLNPQSVLQNSEELNARIRNLTYAGPVIMGLGGIVIVAALVLTFEVRDTLGVKEAPDKRNGNIIVEKKQQKTKNVISVEKEQEQDNQQSDNAAKEPNAQDDDQQAKPSDANEPSTDKHKEQFNQLNNQLNNAPTTVNLPMQVCTIENELRKLSTTSTTKQAGIRAKTPPQTLQLTAKLNQVTVDNIGKVTRQDYRHSRHKPSSANRRAREALPGNRKQQQQQFTNMQRTDILETNLDQLNPSTSSALTTEHRPDRHLSMSYSLDSNTLTTTDHQQVEQIYFGGLHSPQDTELSDTEEPSELCSLSLPPNNTAQSTLTAKSDARCSCTASPEQGDEPELDKQPGDETTRQKLRKQLDKPAAKSSFTSSDYHFVEQQQKMQQQLIVQQQILLEQQQQLTNLIHEKLHISHHHPHSIETSSPMSKAIEIQPQKAISFEQTVQPKSDHRTTISFECPTGKPLAIRSLPINSSFEPSSKCTSNTDLKMMNIKSKSIASIESDSLSDSSKANQLKNELKNQLSSSSKQRPLSSKSLKTTNLVTSRPNRPKASSSQHLEFNINMSDCPETDVRNFKNSSNLSIN